VLRFVAVKGLPRFAVACAVIALVFACLGSGGDPQLPHFAGDEGDSEIEVASPALSKSLPVSSLEPPAVPPRRGSVFVDSRPPHAFLTTAEVFRPPRTAG
jgi:hypothetical protein